MFFVYFVSLFSLSYNKEPSTYDWQGGNSCGLPFIQTSSFLSASKENQKDKELKGKHTFIENEEEEDAKKGPVYEVLDSVMDRKLAVENLINGSNDQNEHKELKMNKTCISDVKGSRNVNNEDLKVNSSKENTVLIQRIQPCQCNKQKMNDAVKDEHGQASLSYNLCSNNRDLERRGAEVAKKKNENNNQGGSDGVKDVEEINKNSDGKDDSSKGKMGNEKINRYHTKFNSNSNKKLRKINCGDNDDRTDTNNGEWESSYSSSFEGSRTTTRVY
jgi:hypothetical protein